MVIRTEYRGQRYSMGSSDPLPARFEIRFGSLNFQATKTATSCTSPTATSFTRGGRPDRDQSPSRPVPTPRCPSKRTLRTPQHHDTDDAPTSALDRMERRRATRVASLRDATTGEMATAPAGERAVPEPQFPHDIRNAAMAYASSAGTDAAVREGHPGG
jgi:hypothetical protein